MDAHGHDDLVSVSAVVSGALVAGLVTFLAVWAIDWQGTSVPFGPVPSVERVAPDLVSEGWAVIADGSASPQAVDRALADLGRLALDRPSGPEARLYLAGLDIARQRAVVAGNPKRARWMEVRYGRFASIRAR